MRKSSFRFIIAALAATAALVACTKEIAPGKVDTDSASQAAEGSRVIAVSFAPQTKTYLEGLQPKFNDGDSVLLVTVPKARGAVQDTQTVAVSVDPTTKSATLTTTLQGNLIALYPAKLAELKGTSRWHFLISDVQSGRFEDANVCSAEISAGSAVASFRNEYPLLKITPPNKTRKLTIRSLPPIGSDGQRKGKTVPINNNMDSRYAVTVSGPILSMPDTAYYVAIIPKADFENLSFEAEFDADGNTGAVKGIVKEKLDIVREKDTIDGTSQIRAGWAYTIDGSDWHEYVTVGGRKWATMNLGADTVNDYGNLYSWGNLTGQSGDSGYDPAFSSAGYAGTNGSKIDNSTVFWNMKTNDAVCNEFNGSWHMPTSQDFIDLDTACGGDGNVQEISTISAANISNGKVQQGKYWLEESQTVLSGIDELESINAAGLLYSDGENYLFFPAAGVSGAFESESREDGGISGGYWSSTWYSSGYAYCMYFLYYPEIGNEVDPQANDRCFGGYSIRAIVDEPVIKEKDKKEK